MEKELVEKYRKLWDKWEVRACILFSLLLQIFLIFSASFRKQKTKLAKFLRPVIWLAYLTADAVAIFALGLLSDSIDPSKRNLIKSLSPATGQSYNALLAFWAPFLLLHLGGPDTITAFALEDNELWLRHFLWLVVEVIVAGYIFVISLIYIPNNSLLLPTLLMFVAGIIKYVERTWALYLASNDGFKGSIPKPVDPGTNYAKLIDEYKVNKEAGLPTIISIPEEYPAVALKTDKENESREEKLAAYEFFTIFKGLISDLLLNFNDRKQSSSFLLSRKSKEAFKIMDIELGFAYDILYTKAQVVHKLSGYITRAVCFICVLVSFLWFWFLPKRESYKSDVNITYALLGGAMVLDAVSLVYLIFSDWTLVFLGNRPWLGWLRTLISKMVTHRRSLGSTCVSQYNLIDSRFDKYNHCIAKAMEKFFKSLLPNKFVENFFHTHDEKVKEELLDFIFQELKKKAEVATDLKISRDLSSCRGSRALENHEKLKWTVDEVEVEFVESILLWHIATDLCYHKDSKKNEAQTEAVDNDQNEAAAAAAVSNDQNEAESEAVKTAKQVEKWRQISKAISEYIVYLLVVHPSMISSIEGVRQIKFRDACEETMSIIKAQKLKDRESAREALLKLSEEMPNSTDRTKMVLFDACHLAQILSEMEDRWKTISEVWAEFLAYAATQCRGNYHAKCLSRGGELLTHVWLLMAHLGLGQQYHVASSHANAKVIVEK